MSKVRNDLFNLEEIVVDDVNDLEIEINLRIISDAYKSILRLKDSRFATAILLDLLCYDEDLVKLSDMKEWFKNNE